MNTENLENNREIQMVLTLLLLFALLTFIHVLFFANIGASLFHIQCNATNSGLAMYLVKGYC